MPLAVASPFRPLAMPGLITLAGAVVLLAVTLAHADRPAMAVVWGSVALAAWCAGLLCVTAGAAWGDLGLVRWKIGPWMLASCVVTSGLATVTWNQPQVGVAVQIGLPSVLRALWLVAVGMTAWALGYRVGPGCGVRRLALRGMGALSARVTSQVRNPQRHGCCTLPGPRHG